MKKRSLEVGFAHIAMLDRSAVKRAFSSWQIVEGVARLSDDMSGCVDQKKKLFGLEIVPIVVWSRREQSQL